ncbi:hypothetical protein NG796_24650 [Laspinema sp. A4]|uniref:hypothetical protein n=1 Tax=Laspinema sp. D2d TaxID=2953686 RepID=UPI0021BB9044|nr:hypothetical protein [Laspinema sp. D2d]MCT7986466.1 hypothetical protein [Laspinema sp. D2d]
MTPASELIEQYKKATFYNRREALGELGYDVEPTKEGRNAYYSDEQVELFRAFDEHIKTTGSTEGFPPKAGKLTVAEEELDMNPEVDREFESNPGLHLTEEEFAQAQEGALRLYDEASKKRIEMATLALAAHYAKTGLSPNPEQQAHSLKLQCEQALSQRFGSPYEVADAAVKMAEKKRPR